MKYESGKDLMWNKLWAILSLYVVALLLEIFTVICNQSYFVSNFLSDQIAFFMAIILKNTVFGCCFLLWMLCIKFQCCIITLDIIAKSLFETAYL